MIHQAGFSPAADQAEYPAGTGTGAGLQGNIDPVAGPSSI